MKDGMMKRLAVLGTAMAAVAGPASAQELVALNDRDVGDEEPKKWRDR